MVRLLHLVVCQSSLTYAERDLARGTYTESEIQEFVDDFVLKLRTVKFRTYKSLRRTLLR